MSFRVFSYLRTFLLQQCCDDALTKPKERFSGKSPLSMLTSTVGTRQVEEMLFQLAEGFSF
ncbi:DUF2384 domain-containing protein [Pseudomonas syringae]|nr:DUF2384 domain-containing protein [Pseudomonas syringae]MCF5210591.1 DUF2384 domain-containing protein [Pseudomonas syringae]MCF5212568.1 DUF2384 domain-containing protein [Pseudomonas syringae]MCF5220710.1 DUF2384 domain-containing protein [Pseudomonas syringae]MCF5266703.1 DUF2384 domain-containing protein [Pseudomonas syringae]